MKYIAMSNVNDKLSKLRGIDLQELLVQIEKFDLEYRDTLSLPNDVTFGTEIEYEKIDYHIVDKFIDENYSSWYSDTDGSLNSGGEISSPILRDNLKSWNQLKSICDFLKNEKANADDMAGGHIHIGANVIGSNVEKWKKFIKFYIVYESIIFRFAYGDKVKSRKKLKRYAPPIADRLYKQLDKLNCARDIDDIKNILYYSDRFQAINFSNISFSSLDSFEEDNTIEFRVPNGTIEEVIWQNNINAITKLMLAPSKNMIDIDYLEYKIKEDGVLPEYRYNIVDLQNALEFVDMIFDNNLDKIYFLKQYIKGFLDIYNKGEHIKPKILVK